MTKVVSEYFFVDKSSILLSTGVESQWLFTIIESFIQYITQLLSIHL